MTHDEALASIWGWNHGSDGPFASNLRRPLPVTDLFEPMVRCCGDIGGVHYLLAPPYITAGMDDRGGVEFMLCRADGWRAARYRGDMFSLAPDDSAWIYADGSGAPIPESWDEPIAAALAEVRERFPDAEVRFR